MFKESGHVNGFTCVINYNVCTMALYDWINPCICTLGKLILCVFFYVGIYILNEFERVFLRSMDYIL